MQFSVRYVIKIYYITLWICRLVRYVTITFDTVNACYLRNIKVQVYVIFKETKIVFERLHICCRSLTLNRRRNTYFLIVSWTSIGKLVSNMITYHHQCQNVKTPKSITKHLVAFSFSLTQSIYLVNVLHPGKKRVLKRGPIQNRTWTCSNVSMSDGWRSRPDFSIPCLQVYIKKNK